MVKRLKLTDVNLKDFLPKMTSKMCMESRYFLKRYFTEDDFNKKAIDKEEIHIIVQVPAAAGKCLPMIYFSNKKFAVTKYVLFFSRYFRP
jgi:hypothetical protein